MTASLRAQTLAWFGLPLSIVFVADLITKSIAERKLTSPIEVAPFLDLKLHYNYGISFGMLQAADPTGRWALIAVTGVFTTALIAWGWREQMRTTQLALALIAGGAVGNLVDRVEDGRVTDFLDAHLNGWHWPIFNVADIAISAGVAVLLLTLLPRKAV